MISFCNLRLISRIVFTSVVMNEVLNIFSNRELAAISWLGVLFSILLIYCLYNKTHRLKLKQYIKSLLAKEIILAVLPLLFYITAIVAILYELNFWDISLLKETIVWAFFSAIAISFKYSFAKNANFLSLIIINNLKLIVIFEFIINLYTFSFIVEMILFLIILLVSLAIYRSNPEEKKYILFLNIILFALVCGMTIYSILKMDPTIPVCKQFLLPLVLAVLTLPYFYLFVIYMRYSDVFRFMNNYLWNMNGVTKLKLKLLIIYYGHISLIRIARIYKEVYQMSELKDTELVEFVKRIASSSKCEV